MPPLHALPHIQVWIVEDDLAFREAFVEAVGPSVGLTGVFTSVEEAVAHLDLDAETPDVVLMDVNLPGLSGIEGIAAVKAHAPSTRIVMLTIRDDAETIADALAAGASGYVTKGALPDHVLQALAAAHEGGMLMEPAVARIVQAAFERVPTPEYGLTAREREVLAEMVVGGTQHEIGERLFISPHTVNKHIQHIYEKLHVQSGSAAVAKAIQERLLG